MMDMTYMWALYAREVKRFQKLWLDTVLSPIVSMGLYLSVFGVVVGDRDVQGTGYLAFVYTGLLVMNLVNSSFSNPSFALIISKNLGTLVDLQVAPIKPWRVGIAYALAALTRALLTLVVALLCTIWFVPGLHLLHPLFLTLGLVITGVEFGLLGVIFGFWGKNFESLTFITTFVMQPMIFLAGVFYPIGSLPGIWSRIAFLNPIHHNVNLLRYTVTGYADISPVASLLVMIGVTTVLFFIMQTMAQHRLRQ
mgnify:CR=1